MEPIKNQLQNIQQNQQMMKSSNEAESSTKTIPADRHYAIWEVINLSRGTLGWSLKESKELDKQIQIWALTFDHYKIPNEYLKALWARARDLRIARLSNAQDCPDFTAELLAASWIGSNGLKAEIERENIAQGRTLPSNVRTGCPFCFNTGMRYSFEDGKPKHITGKCDHKE